jgi:hypothetical protein
VALLLREALEGAAAADAARDPVRTRKNALFALISRALTWHLRRKIGPHRPADVGFFLDGTCARI